jgi:glucose repression regulatory protein TUP1
VRLPLLSSSPPPFISSLVESQISELGTIRRSLFDLEAQHERAHSHYEEEIKRIRSELAAIRQSGTVPVSLGIPGRSPRQLGALSPFPNTPAMSEAHPSSQLLRHRPLERDLPERDLRDRSRDPERDFDQHDAKRQKTRWNYAGSYFFSSFSNIIPHSDNTGTGLFSRSSTFSEEFRF